MQCFMMYMVHNTQSETAFLKTLFYILSCCFVSWPFNVALNSTDKGNMTAAGITKAAISDCLHVTETTKHWHDIDAVFIVIPQQ